MNIENSKREIALDCNKNIVMRIDHSVSNSILKDFDTSKAFADCDFITLDKKDAEAIMRWLDEYCSSKFEGDDIKAFGDMAISYERLHDALEGVLYPEESTATI